MKLVVIISNQLWYTLINQFKWNSNFSETSYEKTLTKKDIYTGLEKFSINSLSFKLSI